MQQLTNALLEIEEERAIWSAKEKAALLAIEEQARSTNEKITSLSTELSEVRIMALLIRDSLDKVSANTSKRKLEMIINLLNNSFSYKLQLTSVQQLFQNLKIELSTVTNERDKLMTKMEDQQKHVMEVELQLKHCQDEVN